ncbi:nucleotidyltransferase family protein [Kineococcus esterisolvens]|uniref:nucleotidyltransferase family protein n=1 Tax=unclassified Kineococcus TaxID=2621656 RepID=UPI003D7DA1DF
MLQHSGAVGARRWSEPPKGTGAGTRPKHPGNTADRAAATRAGVWWDRHVQAVGVVLAAGAGTRVGAPKALLRTAEGTSWAARTAQVLHAGGCAAVAVTVGAAAGEVRAGLPAHVDVLTVPDWRRGPGTGVLAALRYARAAGAQALLLMLVDLPDVGADDVRAVLAVGAEQPSAALVRAGWQGRGGHPVLLGRRHWARAAEVAASGAGLRELLLHPGCREVEVAGAVRDVDVPDALPPGTHLPQRGGVAGGGTDGGTGSGC